MNTALLIGAGVLLLFIVGVIATSGPKRRPNLINLDRHKIRLDPAATNTLPIIQKAQARWGIMQRREMSGAGRREFGNALFVGGPGRGKSNLLKTWLLTADTLNFVVIDLKGDLWKETAGHRATLGPVYRLDLTSMTGHTLDPFDTLTTPAEADALALLEIVLDSDGNYFAQAAQSIAAAYLKAARDARTYTPALPVMVQAAKSDTPGMLQLARDLLANVPADKRAAREADFRAAFADVWDDPSAASGGERGSVLNSFRTALAPLDVPAILSTFAGDASDLNSAAVDVTALLEGRATLYISAPRTDPPYKLPLEILLGAVIDEIFRQADANGRGEEIVILADEAGELKVPRFSSILATGRSRGVSLTAFLQDFGQLKRYHPDGWKGLTDTVHHWTLWKPKNPDADSFLRSFCGVYDVPNPDPEDRQRRRWIERSSYDDIAATWPETHVISLLDYERIHVLFGEAVHPFTKAIEPRRGLPTPPLPTKAPAAPPAPAGGPPAATLPPAPAPTTPQNVRKKEDDLLDPSFFDDIDEEF